MPDPPNQCRDAIWASFQDYLQEPYADNPRQRAVMQRWYEELRSRHDIDLTHAQISNLQNGRSFNAYVINQQVLPSHDVRVLSQHHSRAVAAMWASAFTPISLLPAGCMIWAAVMIFINSLSSAAARTKPPLNTCSMYRSRRSNPA